MKIKNNQKLKYELEDHDLEEPEALALESSHVEEQVLEQEADEAEQEKLEENCLEIKENIDMDAIFYRAREEYRRTEISLIQLEELLEEQVTGSKAT